MNIRRVLLLLLGTWTSHAQTIVFDDFNYASNTDPAISSFNRWEIVNGTDGPIYPASYQRNQITFTEDVGLQGNKIMSVNATCTNQVSGIVNGRIQTSGYEYTEGTYAARVFFDDAPVANQDGSIQTFYSIVNYLLGPDASKYSEVDFEYLPYNVWGNRSEKTMYMTSYNSYTENQLINASIPSVKSYAGWHTLVYSFTDKVNVKFWIDGLYLGSVSLSSDPSKVTVYPRSPMQVAFANWIWHNAASGNFTGPGILSRTYSMKVDWFLYIKGSEVLPSAVTDMVNVYRSQGVQRRNLAGEVYPIATNILPQIQLVSPSMGGTFTAPANISLSANASDPDGSISKVEFFANSVLLFSDVTAPYTYTWTNAPSGSYVLSARATDNKNATATATANITITPNQNPFGSSPTPIPGLLQAENYDLGGPSVAYSDQTSLNLGGSYRADQVDLEPCTDQGGGFNVGWIATGEWLEYTVNINSPGTYQLQARVAAISSGKSFHLEIDGATIAGPISVPNTGGWQQWQTVTVTTSALSVGTKILRVVFDSPELNLNYIRFILSTTPNLSPLVTLTAPSNGITVVSPASITLTASASDADGSISKVEFFSNNTLLFTDVTAPYSYTLSGVSAGSYKFTARATDDRNAATTSAAVQVTVTNPSACTLPAWNASQVYVAPQRVSRNGTIYEAKWWTQNQDPLLNSGTWEVWKIIGSCQSRLSLDKNSDRYVLISPNPSVGQVVLEFQDPEAQEASISFTNVFGQQVYTASQLSSGTVLVLQSLPSGVYTVTFTVGNEVISSKFIKQ